MSNPTAPRSMLIVTPRFPYPGQGACEKDRLGGIRQMLRLGYTVSVLTRRYSFEDGTSVDNFARELGVRLVTVPEREERRSFFGRFRHAGYFDGAAYAYADKEVVGAFVSELDTNRPDIVWFDYTYLWPLYSYARDMGISIITRSINYEPRHFLEEDGASLINILKAIPKYLSERIVARKSDHIFAITPDEEKIYRKLGAKSISTLPLRDLANYAGRTHEIRDRKPLKACFMGSTYNVNHNREALRFVITKLAPEMARRYRGEYVFHILGAKLPSEFLPYFNDTVIYSPQPAGEFDAFLDDMDVAIAPSFFGAGMQQKVFEPITRGIPTIASPRAIAQYPFVSGAHFLEAEGLSQYLVALHKLCDVSLRNEISTVANQLTKELFMWERYDSLVEYAVAHVLGSRKM